MTLLELYELAIDQKRERLQITITLFFLHMLTNNDTQVNYIVERIRGYLDCLEYSGEITTTQKALLLCEVFNIELEYRKYKQYKQKQLQEL